MHFSFAIKTSNCSVFITLLVVATNRKHNSIQTNIRFEKVHFYIKVKTTLACVLHEIQKTKAIEFLCFVELN